MSTQRTRRLLGAIGVAVTAVAGLWPGPALAHNAGRVELLVTNLQFRAAGSGAGGVAVSADLVDRDSGETAAGFAVVVSARRADGQLTGPLTLTDPQGTGHYEGHLALMPGDWVVTAKAEQGLSALPALGSTRVASVRLDPAGTVTQGRTPGAGRSGAGRWVALAGAALVLAAGVFLAIGRRSAASGGEPVGRAVGSLLLLIAAVTAFGPMPEAGAQETPTTVPQYGTRPVNITLEVRTDYADSLPSSLYIPLRARLTDAATGRPVADPYTVRAGVRVPEGARESYDFAYPHGTVDGAEAGVYNGLVIVPAGGRWTVVVNAYNIPEAESGRLPRSLGVAQIEVDATGAALETTQGRTSSDVAGNVNPRAEKSEVALLFVHTVVAGVWFALAAVMVLLGHPGRRRMLSVQLSDLLDRNVRRLSQGLLWSTVVVWGTGLLNLQKAVPFAPPLSSAQATRLFRLPYARPYTLALYTKIGIYVLLTLAAVALVKEARRRVAEFDEARFRSSLAADADPAPLPPGRAVAFTPRRSATALAVRPAAAPVQTPTGAAPPAFRIARASLVIGGAAIVFCVTVLKYCHILSEAVRGLQ